MSRGDALQAALAALREQGADHLDPVGFRYIEAMERRAALREGPAAAIVREKAARALDAYRERAAQASDALQAPAGHCGPAQLQQLEAALRSRAHCDALAALSSLLDATGDAQQGSSGPGDSLQAQLQRQEAEILAALPDGNETAPATPPALKSALQIRAAVTRDNAERLVGRALSRAPENSGPLNPQKLVTQSLAEMRQLSPAYLDRFVSWVDTLFWLEQSGQ